MRTILHILTRPENELTRALIEHQRALPETAVEVVRLLEEASDYDALITKIFAADSIEVS
ncbi:MAG TPA: hypothetical protein VNT99_09400 [Methylomirabilota bacterium]|nr:hypothetical protein [Methylomirabilota bacterium]